MSIEVDCTWGDGPAVLLSLNGKNMVLHEELQKSGRWVHGSVTQGSACLTADEALALASQLQLKALQAKELDQQCKDHDEAVGDE
jgi:hypothetical protein